MVPGEREKLNLLMRRCNKIDNKKGIRQQEKRLSVEEDKFLGEGNNYKLLLQRWEQNRGESGIVV